MASSAVGYSSGTHSAGTPSTTPTLQQQASLVQTVAKSLSARYDSRTSAEKRDEVEKASFWIPESTPEATGSTAAAPDPAPRDPISGTFLRPKQLIVVKLTLAKPPRTDEEDTGVGVDEQGKTGRFMCPACMKVIVFQKTYLFKQCGHVLCDKCVSAFVIPSKQCFQCSAPVRQNSTTNTIYNLQYNKPVSYNYAAGSESRCD